MVTNALQNKPIFLLFLFFANCLLGQDLTSGLKAYFNFNQETIVDLSETELNGIPIDVTKTKGIEDTINSAFLFNGTSSRILCETDNRGVSNQVSLSIWIKTLSSERQLLFSKYNATQDDKGFFLATLNGTATLGGRDGSNTPHEIYDSEVLINDGEWHHIVGVINKNDWRLYIDCIEVASKTTNTNTPIFTSNDPLTIGFWFEGNSQGTPRYFNGSIDEARLYNRPLNIEDIGALCDQGNYIVIEPNVTSGLKAYYNFNQETILDLSEIALNGTGVNLTRTRGIEDTINSAYLFNGSSSEILCQTDNRGISDQVSLSTWIKTFSPDRQLIFSKYNSAQDKGYFLAMLNGAATLGGRDGSNEYHEIFDSEILVNDGEWHHLTGIIDQNEWRLYVDCNEVAAKTTTTASPLFQNTDPLTIGFWFEGTAEGNKRYFNGTIDELRLYNRPLNLDEINLLCDKAELVDIPTLSYPIPDVKLFPNPTTDFLNISTERGSQLTFDTYQIIDILGRMVKAGSLNDSKIDVINLEKGTYFLLLKEKGKPAVSLKFLLL